MEINIYQVNSDRDKNHVLFMDLQHLEKYQGDPDVDCEIYDKVFSGKVDCKTLEDVYVLFNTKLVENHHGHSLSVSDIVEVVDDLNVDEGFYFCNNFGFTRVEFSPELTTDRTHDEQIKVILVQEGKLAKSVSIDNKLEAMQKLVGGQIEEYMPFEDDVAIICNEEGKMCGLPLNRAIYAEATNEMIEIMAGDFFVAYAPIDSEKFESLPKELEEKYLKKFKKPEKFIKLNNEIKAIPYTPKSKDLER